LALNAHGCLQTLAIDAIERRDPQQHLPDRQQHQANKAGIGRFADAGLELKWV
jgi:hypothetical protein